MIGRFVENEDAWVHHRNDGERNSTLLTSGERRNRLSGQVTSYAEFSEERSVLFGRLTREFRLEKLDCVLIQIQLIYVMLTEVADFQVSVSVSQALARLQRSEQQFE